MIYEACVSSPELIYEACVSSPELIYEACVSSPELVTELNGGISEPDVVHTTLLEQLLQEQRLKRGI
jgi:hypothetical protein